MNFGGYHSSVNSCETGSQTHDSQHDRNNLLSTIMYLCFVNFMHKHITRNRLFSNVISANIKWNFGPLKYLWCVIQELHFLSELLVAHEIGMSCHGSYTYYINSYETRNLVGKCNKSSCCSLCKCSNFKGYNKKFLYFTKNGVSCKYIFS